MAASLTAARTGLAVLLIFALTAAGACAPRVSGNEPVPRAARGKALAGGEAPGAITLPHHAGASVLVALPAVATYAFTVPSTVFGNISPAEDALASDPSMESLRESAATVLRGNGWREVPSDSAQFHVSVASTARPHVALVSRPDPRGEVVLPRRCGVSSPPGCQEPLPPRYAPIVTRMPITEYRIGVAIVRVEDKARKAWMLEGNRPEVERFVSREVLRLLLVETR